MTLTTPVDGGVTFLDYEIKAECAVTVTATNAGGTASIDVAIQVENLDESGVVSVSPGSRRCSVQQAASLSDPYGDATLVSWSWEKSEDGTTWTAIDGAPEASGHPREGRHRPSPQDDGRLYRSCGACNGAVWESAAPISSEPLEPTSVGRVSNLLVIAEGQTRGSVGLSWTPA